MGKTRKVLIYIFLTIGAVSMVLPFYWMVITAFKTPAEAISIPATWFPKTLNFDNFTAAWQKVPWIRYFLNTLLIAVLTLIGNLLTAILSAYAFAKMDFKGRDKIFILFLATMMIPMPVYIIPGYLILTYLGWIDTYAALIVPWIVPRFF